MCLCVNYRCTNSKSARVRIEYLSRALSVQLFHRVHVRDTVQHRTRNPPDITTLLITL